MPASDQQRVDELVRKKLEFVLSLAKGSFAGDIAKRITLGNVQLEGVQLEGNDDTVSSQSRPLGAGRIATNSET